MDVFLLTSFLPWADQCQVICILFFNRIIKVFIFITRAAAKVYCHYFNPVTRFPEYLLPVRYAPASCVSGASEAAVCAGTLVYCASAVRQPPRPASAGALTADGGPRRLWSPLQCASAHHLRFPPFSPSTPPSPSRSRLRGAVNPVRRPEAGHRRRSLCSRKIMYQPTRGAARRLGPCLRAYQARPQVRAERNGRGGEGRGPSSEPARGAERAPRPRRRSSVLLPLFTCAGRRGRGAGSLAGTRGLRSQPWGARDVGFPGSGRRDATAFRPRSRGYLALEVT